MLWSRASAASSPRSSFLQRRFSRWAALFAFCAGTVVFFEADDVAAKPKTHTVYKGQRLGSIAKRYNVSVDALCRANGISRRDPIHPGQKLIIPGTDDGKGSAKKSKKKNSKRSAPNKPRGKTRVHTVAKGHTLSAIAGRYAITISALCNANGINRNASLKVGQRLVIPHKSDKDGEYARRQRKNGDFDERSSSRTDKKAKSGKGTKSWKKYEKPAWRKGYIKIRRYGRAWKGYVIGPKGEVLGHASNKINYVMGAKKDGPRIHPKLIRLIAKVSDNFGGRELRIVSGYRTKSFVAASKHKQGRAIDFSIPGIPNEALRDYLRTIDNVGVGYYPNSSFVHLDVRGYNSYWVDYAGPGEAPRKSPKGKSRKKKSKAKADDHGHDHSHGDAGSKKPAPQEGAPSQEKAAPAPKAKADSPAE